jgi:hypothetical protein
MSHEWNKIKKDLLKIKANYVCMEHKYDISDVNLKQGMMYS